MVSAEDGGQAGAEAALRPALQVYKQEVKSTLNERMGEREERERELEQASEPVLSDTPHLLVLSKQSSSGDQLFKSMSLGGCSHSPTTVCEGKYGSLKNRTWSGRKRERLELVLLRVLKVLKTFVRMRAGNKPHIQQLDGGILSKRCLSKRSG